MVVLMRPTKVWTVLQIGAQALSGEAMLAGCGLEEARCDGKEVCASAAASSAAPAQHATSAMCSSAAGEALAKRSIPSNALETYSLAYPDK